MSLTTPEWFIKAVQKEINLFLWCGKPPRIKFRTAIANYDAGGLKLTEIDCYVRSQKAIWVKRLLKDVPPFYYLSEFIPNIALNDMLQCSIHPDDLSFDIPSFYRQVLHAWFTYLHIDKTMPPDPYSEVLWYNTAIKIDDKPIFFIKNGIIKVYFILVTCFITQNAG